MLKEDLRKYIAQEKRQFSPNQLEKLSLPILDRLRPLLHDANVVLAYYSLPDEVYTHDLIVELVSCGKTVLLPKVVDDVTMILYRYHSDEDLREGAFHIMEPVGELFTDYSRIDTILVPGVAFDACGHRLGRGRGYYDRFLRLCGGRKIGVCFDFQKVKEVPIDENDILMDQIV